MRYLMMTAAVAGTCLGGMAALAADSIGVSQKGRAFSPARIEAKNGQTVVFHNDDTVPHNIAVRTPGGKTENGGTQRPGQDYTLILTEAGDYQINCIIHPKMVMAIEVK